MTQQTRQDIESWLWECANILRGPVDPANLHDFVFPLPFLKRPSETWDEEQEKVIKKFGNDIGWLFGFEPATQPATQMKHHEKQWNSILDLPCKIGV